MERETAAIHAGRFPDKETGARAEPIYMTSAYVFRDAEEAAGRFSLTVPGNIYTRLTNPNTSSLETRLAAIEGGSAAITAASGMAAISYAVLALTNPGDEIVSADNLYGGTYELFHLTLPNFGRTVKFVKSSDLEALEMPLLRRPVPYILRRLEIRSLMFRTLKQLQRLHTVPACRSSLTIRSVSAWCVRWNMGQISSFFLQRSMQTVMERLLAAQLLKREISRGTTASSRSSPNRTRHMADCGIMRHLAVQWFLPASGSLSCVTWERLFLRSMHGLPRRVWRRSI